MHGAAHHAMSGDALKSRANGGRVRVIGKPSAIQEGDSMELGAFSVSLAVKDIAASKAFYEKLGFSAFGGDQSQGWLILKNGSTVIGLFQGMFDKNILTFNPGWDQSAQPLAEFADVREVQKSLDAQGVALDARADPQSKGPAHILLTDPDGNTIMLDQHV
jgi:catechol 2,3-dioxygenase-like lactoylglutathione lyase family enzyme